MTLIALIIWEYKKYVDTIYFIHTFEYLFILSEVETVHGPGAELGNAIKIVNQVCICKRI